MTPDQTDFHRIMAAWMQQMAMQPLLPPPEVYKLTFNDKSAIYYCSRHAGVLEAIASAGMLRNRKAVDALLPLLSLGFHHGGPPLMRLVLNDTTDELYIDAHLPLAGADNDSLTKLTRRVRAYAAAAQAIVDGKSASDDRPEATQVSGGTFAIMQLRRGG